jgi:hypothetical protein
VRVIEIDKSIFELKQQRAAGGLHVTGRDEELDGVAVVRHRGAVSCRLPAQVQLSAAINATPRDRVASWSARAK